MGYFTDEEVAALAATQAPRCLGCATAVAERGEAHTFTSERYGVLACSGRYEVGERVDYDLWLSMLRRFADVEPFDRWAAAEPCLGLASWFTRYDRARRVSA